MATAKQEMDGKLIISLVMALFAVAGSYGVSKSESGAQSVTVANLGNKIDAYSNQIEKLRLDLTSAKEELAGKGAAMGKEIEQVLSDIQELKTDTTPKDRVKAYFARVDSIEKNLVPRSEILGLDEDIKEIKFNLKGYASKSELASTDADILDVKTRKIKLEDALAVKLADMESRLTKTEVLASAVSDRQSKSGIRDHDRSLVETLVTNLVPNRTDPESAATSLRLQKLEALVATIGTPSDPLLAILEPQIAAIKEELSKPSRAVERLSGLEKIVEKLEREASQHHDLGIHAAAGGRLSAVIADVENLKKEFNEIKMTTKVQSSIEETMMDDLRKLKAERAKVVADEASYKARQELREFHSHPEP